MAKWTKEAIREKIMTDDKWLIRGLLAIYRHQTDSEKNAGQTHEENGVGFNGVDSAILSDMAKQYITRDFLTTRQIAIVRDKMKKYAGQLTKIANGEIK